LCRLSRPQGHSAAGSVRSIEKSNNLIGNRNRDLQSRDIVPQPTMLPRAPVIEHNETKVHSVCIFKSFRKSKSSENTAGRITRKSMWMREEERVIQVT
jgi:hypothetical protein